MNYGKVLEQIRERIGYTKNDIAKLLKIDKSLYGRYENETQTIPLKHLITLANFYKMTLDYLFGFSKENNYKSPIKEPDKLKIGKKLKSIRKFKKITQASLASLLNTTQSVIADYERGRYLISTAFLYAICKNYKISADYIINS